MNSSAILDIVILAVLALFAILGARKGFFRMLADALMVLAASVGARLLSNAFAPKAAAALAPIVREQVLRRLELALEGALEGALDGVLEQLPSLSGLLGSSLDSSGLLGHLSEAVLAQAVEELTYAMARSLLFMLSFAALMIALKCFVKATNIMLHLPVLRQCNALLGAVVGLAVGCLLAVIVTRVLYTFGWFITEEVAGGSILMGLFGRSLPPLPKL